MSCFGNPSLRSEILRRAQDRLWGVPGYRWVGGAPGKIRGFFAALRMTSGEGGDGEVGRWRAVTHPFDEAERMGHPDLRRFEDESGFLRFAAE